MLIKVGQEVFVVHATYRSNEAPNTSFQTVTRVGKKYFYTKGQYGTREIKYDIATLVESTESNYKDVAYLKEQDYLDRLEANKIRGEIMNLIGTWGSGLREMSLTKLKKIKQLMEKEE